MLPIKSILLIAFLLILPSFNYSQEVKSDDSTSYSYTTSNFVLREKVMNKIINATETDDEAEMIGSIEIGQGFRFKDYHHPQFYSVSTTAKTTLKIDRTRISALVHAVFSDGLTNYFYGNQAAYIIHKKPDWNIQVTASSMFGTQDRKLYGGGLIFEKKNWYLSVNARQEHENKELWFDGSVGLKIF